MSETSPSPELARKLTPQQIFDDLLARHEPLIADAFREAVEDLRSSADRQRLLAALQQGRIEDALRSLKLEAAVYDRVLEAIRTAYIAGGVSAASASTVSVRFGARHVRAEAWLSEHSAKLITRIIEDQREAIRLVLSAMMARGSSPRSMVTAIVGTVERTTGRRVGGILGLTRAQAEAVLSARRELSSADPADLRKFLERARRDRRFDRTILAAIRDGKPLPAETIGKSIVAYERRLLALRAETIARTETITALNAATYEAALQAVDSGAVLESQVRRVWRSAMDGRVRETHRDLNGETVGLRESFTSPSGASLRYPGDPNAPASEIINCRCWCETRFTVNPNLR